MAYVYKHIIRNNEEVFYVGIGKTKNYKRATTKNGRNESWIDITNKCEYYYVIIEDHLTWEEACEREIFWVKFYGRKDLGNGTLINRTNGGAGIVGRIVSEETKKKLSIANKKCKPPSRLGIKVSEETKVKIKKKLLGRKLPEEVRKKYIGRKQSSETIQKKINSLKGHVVSDETRKKLSITNKGKIPPPHVIEARINGVRGKQLSDERKEQISKSLKLFYLNKRNNIT